MGRDSEAWGFGSDFRGAYRGSCESTLSPCAPRGLAPVCSLCAPPWEPPRATETETATPAQQRGPERLLESLAGLFGAGLDLPSAFLVGVRRERFSVLQAALRPWVAVSALMAVCRGLITPWTHGIRERRTKQSVLMLLSDPPDVLLAAATGPHAAAATGRAASGIAR